MSSQVISYRLSTDEVLQLRQKALPGESDNQTAQRLMRETLGVSTVSTITPSLSTVSLNERIESILDERLSSFANNQNDLLSRLQERIQEVEAQLKKLSVSNPAGVDKLQTDVDRLQKERDQLDVRNLELEAADGDLKHELLNKDEEIAHLNEELGKLAIAPQPMTQDQEPLTQAELAKRLNCDSGTLTKNRKKSSFQEWSQSRDPEGKSWKYLPDTHRYGLVEVQKLTWEARVDEVVGSL
jgi:chromosome segregation ATPase